jgi:two-component system LytT family response regulator
MSESRLLHVYLVDDEPLALKRLRRLLRESGKADIVGSATNPEEAQAFQTGNSVDALFLDIQMPQMSGFELLARLPKDLPVVFTTAFDQYALNAFEVNSIDYLLKPIDEKHLERALTKLQRFHGTDEAVRESAQLRVLARELAQGLQSAGRKFPERIASRLGERVVFVDLNAVSHFYAKDKLTYAATATKDYIVDVTIAELEQKLDGARFVRIHRSTLLNLAFIEEVNSWFGGGMVVRLKDGKRTELQVARDRVRELKSRLDF